MCVDGMSRQHHGFQARARKVLLTRPSTGYAPRVTSAAGLHLRPGCETCLPCCLKTTSVLLTIATKFVIVIISTSHQVKNNTYEFTLEY